MRIALIYAGTGDPRRDAASGLRMPPLGLPLLAALTPPGHDVVILDDSRRRINFDERGMGILPMSSHGQDARATTFDLVGISALTPTAERAYELSAGFRKRGAKVVLGGLHVTTLPDEAASHADCVVIGEADEIWPRLVEDVAQGRLRSRYEAAQPASLAGLPTPRWDLLPRGLYHPLRVIETTRGCPHWCEFCVVPRYFGTAFRHRPLDEIERELRSYFPKPHPLFDRLRRWLPARSHVPYFAAKRLLYIVDNNVIGDRRYARELFDLLSDVDVRWIGHAPITIADDQDLMERCRESGCLALNVGFESLDQEALDALGKPFNRAADFERSVEIIHGHGIGIFGTFVVGLESDTPETFERIVCFAERARLEVAFPLILAPLPGTDLLERYRREGRLIEERWRDYDSGAVVYRPRRMGTRQLFEGQRWTFERLFSLGSIRRRLFRAPRVHPLFFLMVNWEFRGKIKHIRRAWAPPLDFPPWEGNGKDEG
jgi:radical SAM superfamily enzyme YgiQ (UPF0313 family)